MAKSGLLNGKWEKRLQLGAGTPLPSRAAAPSRRLLSDREVELLACFDLGLLYKEIEDRLHLSHTALRKRQHRLYVRLGAQNRTEALTRWRQIRGQEPSPPVQNRGGGTA